MSRFVMPLQQWVNGSGDVLPGAKLNFYATGTNDRKDTYADDALTTPNANPVVADSDGVFDDIFLSGVYKVVFTDEDDNEIWTADPVDSMKGDSEISTLASTFLAKTTASEMKDVLRFQVDGLSALQALTDQTSGERAYLTYRNSEGDGAHGAFRWDGATDYSSATGNGLVPADEMTTGEGDGGIYVAPASDKTGASGAWVRDYVNEIQVEWYVAPGGGDFGVALNNIMTLSTLAAFSDTVSVVAGPGTFTCSTTWNLDLANTSSVIKFRGAGMSAGSSPANGTIIDGSAMASNVISGATTKDNYHIRLEQFTVLAGSAGGLIIGKQESGYSAAHSFIENIVVEGGSPGINLEFWTNGWVNHVYSVGASGSGILLDTMNACTFGQVTVRQAAGSWAMTIEKGLGTNYGSLYLESNAKSALRIGDDVRGGRIEQIYTENNNTDNTQAYEILVADQSIAAEDAEAFEIGSMFLSTPAFAYTTSQFAVESGLPLVIGPTWGTSDPLFSTIGSNVQNITFRGWSHPSTETIDLSNCANLSKFTFIGCNINPTNIVWPTNAADVEIIGCNRLLHNEKSVYVSDGSNYSLSPWETHIVVDTDTTAQTTTLPPSSVASGKTYYVVNEGTSTNDITVQPNGAETIMASASVAIADLSMAGFQFEPTRGRWMVVSRGTKS